MPLVSSWGRRARSANGPATPGYILGLVAIATVGWLLTVVAIGIERACWAGAGRQIYRHRVPGGGLCSPPGTIMTVTEPGQVQSLISLPGPRLECLSGARTGGTGQTGRTGW